MMFVGARNHIPRHRRTRLFVRLIEVLGPYHFLGAIMMLLVDADTDESAGSLDLVMSIWESFPGEICVAVSTLCQLLNLLNNEKFDCLASLFRHLLTLERRLKLYSIRVLRMKTVYYHPRCQSFLQSFLNT